MSKTAVVYWSGTGNTEAMAAAVADSVKANGQRPKENALNNSAPAKTKSDPSTWSKSELEDVSRRVQRGEKIKL